MILHLISLYARMSSTDNIKEIDIEYILYYQEVSNNYKYGFWYKRIDVLFCQNDR